MTIETHLLHLVPDSLSDQEAIFTEPLAAAIEILDQIHLHHDKNIAILGDGRLSNMIAQVIALTGADVTVIGRHKDKLEKFASFAKVTVQPEGTFEIVVDATGSPSGIKDAQKLVRKQGIIILKSTYAGKVELDMSWFAVNEITLIGSRCGPFEPALRLLTKRYVKFPEIELYPLSEFNQAFVSKAFKVGFKINQNNKEDIIYESSI